MSTSLAEAIEGAADYRLHPWVYGLEVTDDGHGLNVAHCVASCPEPTSCTCEEITHFTPHQLVDAYCIVLEYDQFCCPALDSFCALDADLVLQIALYQEIVFG